jgi:hypothetical protein
MKLILRLLQSNAAAWQNRTHLVDRARKRAAGKRPGARQKVELSEFLAAESSHIEELPILDEGLTRLGHMDARQGARRGTDLLRRPD